MRKLIFYTLACFAILLHIMLILLFDELWPTSLLLVSLLICFYKCMYYSEPKDENADAEYGRTEKAIVKTIKVLVATFVIWFCIGGGWFLCCVIIWSLWFCWECACNGGSRK